MEQITKKPPNKKRHTKPCKFYQTMRCPYSAEECDFAHVLNSELMSKDTKPCRYYAAGHCNNGTWCRYRHDIEHRIEDQDRTLLKSPDSGSFDSRSSQKHPRQPQHGDEQIALEAQLPPPLYIPPTHVPFHGMHLTSPPWLPYGNTFTPHFSADFVATHASQHNLVSPTTSSDSITSLATSSPASDDIVIIVDDAHTSEQPLYCQSQLSDKIAHCPPAMPLYHSSNVVAAAHSGYPVVSSAFGLHAPEPTESQASMPRQSRSAGGRQKTFNYKTKPCKFYQAGITCPSGDKCTFIHDDPSEQLAATHEEDSESRSPSHGLPSKPVSVREENKKKGYYPVPWRVIGGGVFISGNRSRSLSENNCAHETESSSTDESAEQLTTQTSGIRERPVSEDLSQRISRQSKNPTLSVSVSPFEAVSFPSTTGDDVTPTLRVNPRGRATSMSPTPRSSHVDMLTLFPAESP